jgi:hypothetical protein
VGNAIPGLVYYPEGNPPTVDPQNSSFPTSFTYQIIDSDGNELPSPATMNIQANILVGNITMDDYNLFKDIDYALDEPQIDAAKVIAIQNLTTGYNNSNNQPILSITIESLPSTGQLSLYNGSSYVAVIAGDIIPVASIVANNFAYWPENIDQSGTPSGYFEVSFNYTIQAQYSNPSSTVNLQINCTDVTSNISALPPVLRYNGVDYPNSTLGNTASIFTLTGSGPFTVYFKNTDIDTILFGDVFNSTGTVSNIHLYGNTSVKPIITVSPHGEDLLAPGQVTALTFNRNSVPNGKYLISVTTKIPYSTSFIVGGYYWYITLA